MTEEWNIDTVPLQTRCETPSTVHKTGAWRTLRPIIDYSKCIRCMTCWKFCPDMAIKLVEDEMGPNEKGQEWDRRPEWDYDYCKGCGICAEECPTKCIEMVRETSFKE